MGAKGAERNRAPHGPPEACPPPTSAAGDEPHAAHKSVHLAALMTSRSVRGSVPIESRPPRACVGSRTGASGLRRVRPSRRHHRGADRASSAR